MKPKTYEESVNFCVNWWCENAFDFREDTSLDERINDIRFREHRSLLIIRGVSEKSIELFRNEMKNHLMTNRAYPVYLSCDNGAGDVMEKICRKVKINSLCLPSHAFTKIMEDNTVYYKRGRHSCIEVFPPEEQ